MSHHANTRISSVLAHEILDSRGNTTVDVEVELEGGAALDEAPRVLGHVVHRLGEPIEALVRPGPSPGQSTDCRIRWAPSLPSWRSAVVTKRGGPRDLDKSARF